MASFNTEYKIVMVATSDGTFIGDVQPLSRLQVTCIAEDDGNRQIGILWRRRSHRVRLLPPGEPLSQLREGGRPDCDTQPVSGRCPGWRHAGYSRGRVAWNSFARSDRTWTRSRFQPEKDLCLSNLLGKRVASDVCTIVDDGTLPDRRGSLNMDDEGTATGRTMLIEKGILRGYITDKLNARLLGIPLTGNGRRESYQSIVLPRMTNTFMLAGESNPEDIIKSVNRGLYAVSFGGGQVDITNGKFVFSASEAYLIEDGKVTKPVKGATLIGSGPDILTKVSMVGHDLKLDEGIGTCGKEGQSVPVGVGLPTIRIDEITVGGTQAG